MDTRTQVGAHWDEVQARKGPARTRWWESALIQQRLNRLLDKESGPGISEGLARRARKKLGERGWPSDRRLRAGVSVGGGHGAKEMLLLEWGLVDRVDVFELSQARIADGQRAALAKGLQDRIRFLAADAFEVVKAGDYDLVHWNNALHHMLDVDRAVKWSFEILSPGGLFYMDDFVGPDRFQWSDAALAIASSVRSGLPEAYLVDPRDPQKRLSPTIRRPNPKTLAAADPSEAAQSSRILPAIRTYFPDAEITRTGGLVYNLVLSDVLANIDERTDAGRAALELLMTFDAALARLPAIETHYATALAFKGSPPPKWREATLLVGHGIEAEGARLLARAKGVYRRVRRRT